MRLSCMDLSTEDIFQNFIMQVEEENIRHNGKKLSGILDDSGDVKKKYILSPIIQEDTHTLCAGGPMWPPEVAGMGFRVSDLWRTIKRPDKAIENNVNPQNIERYNKLVSDFEKYVRQRLLLQEKLPEILEKANDNDRKKRSFLKRMFSVSPGVEKIKNLTGDILELLYDNDHTIIHRLQFLKGPVAKGKIPSWGPGPEQRGAPTSSAWQLEKLQDVEETLAVQRSEFLRALEDLSEETGVNIKLELASTPRPAISNPVI